MAGSANIPGGGEILPSVVTNITTQSAGASVPGGIRVAALIGLGSRSETLVSQALGEGNDGLNSTYTSSTGSDGRHFLLQNAPVVSNRTGLFKNGLPLVGLEATIDNLAFSSIYDYRLDIATGRIELQRGALVDQGGAFFLSGSSNVGDGYIANLTLSDVNAPTETWTIKCISVQRNVSNQPVAGTARFVAFGSVSGNILDANGNPVVWVSNGTSVTNTILAFSIFDNTTALREGDLFTVKVLGGSLKKNDSLTATYIATTDLNDPVFFDNTQQINTKHGVASLDNTLSLGAQIAFANITPGIMTVQAAPAIPRRTSFQLSPSVNALSTNLNDFVLPLPPSVQPGTNTTIHFFVTHPTTGVETQLLPNKFAFFTLGTAGQPSVNTFVFDNTSIPAGNSFSYSVINQDKTVNFGTDGYLDRSLTTQINATFSTSVKAFDSSYIGKAIKIFDALNASNNGTFRILNVRNGSLQIVEDATAQVLSTTLSTTPFSNFINESSVSFRLINSVTGAIVPGSAGVDGVITGTGTSATLTSAAINWAPLTPFTSGFDLEITASTNPANIGIFDITGYNSGTDTITMSKCFTSEHSLRFEVIDPTATSSYVVVNHNIVPNNHALRVTVVDRRDESFFDAGWTNAIASLETQEVDMVVPLPKQTISAIFQNTLAHCKTMSNSLNKKERILLCGAINGLTPDNLTGARPAAVEDIGILEGLQGDSAAEILAGNTEDLTNYSVANAFGNTFRCVYFFPDQIVVQVGTDNQIIDGFYVAAAAAGYFSGSINIAVPLTRKILTGFTILRNRQFSNRTLRQLATAGVCALQPVAGGGRCVWGITTSQSGFVEEEEISIVFIRDRIAKNFRTGLDGFIGNPEELDTIPTIATRADGLLQGFISQKLITDYKDLTVKRDAVVPTQYNVTARVQPTYSINFIYVSVSVGLLS
jgi:hypothetical protein